MSHTERKALAPVRRRIRATLALATAGVLSAVLAGCGGGGGNGGKNTLTVTYQQFGDSHVQANFLKSVKKEFEASHKGLTVDLQPISASENDYYTKLQLMMRSPKTAPDLVYEDTFLINSDITAGYLQPLDDYLKNVGRLGASSSRHGEGGRARRWTARRTASRTAPTPAALWYNKEIFAKAGLPADWQPKTWDDVLDRRPHDQAEGPRRHPAERLLRQGGRRGRRHAGLRDAAVRHRRTRCTTTTRKKWVVGSQGFKDALNFVKTVYAREARRRRRRTRSTRTSAPRVAQRAAARGQAGHRARRLLAARSNWLDRPARSRGRSGTRRCGQAAMPTQNGQAPGKVSLSGGWTWAIPAKSDEPRRGLGVHQDAADQGERGQVDVTDGAQIAVRKDVAADPAYVKSQPEHRVLHRPGRRSPHYRPALPGVPEGLQRRSRTAMEAVMTGQLDADEAAKNYDEQVEGIVGKDKTTRAVTVDDGPPRRRRRRDRGRPRRRRAAGMRRRGSLPGCCRWRPAVVLLLVFLAGPIVYCVYIAFTNMALTGAGAATSVRRPRQLPQGVRQRRVPQRVWLTLVFTLVSAIIGQNTLGLALALLMRGPRSAGPQLVGQRDRHRRLGAAGGGRRRTCCTRSSATRAR